MSFRYRKPKRSPRRNRIFDCQIDNEHLMLRSLRQPNDWWERDAEAVLLIDWDSMTYQNSSRKIGISIGFEI